MEGRGEEKRGEKTEIPSLYVFSNTHFFFFIFAKGYLMVVEWQYTAILICTSLLPSDGEKFFMLPLTILRHFKKCLFRSIDHFLISFFLLLSSLFILIINCIWYKWFANIFSHSMNCIFTLLVVSFAMWVVVWCNLFHLLLLLLSVYSWLCLRKKIIALNGTVWRWLSYLFF